MRFAAPVIALPVAIVLGCALGTGIRSVDPQAPGIIWFAIALPVATYLLWIVEQLLLRQLGLDADAPGAWLLRILLDLGAGVLTGIGLAQVTSAPALEAAGMASLALFLQTLIVDKFVLGNAMGDLFVGLFERGLPPEPQFSLAGALAARGDYQGAQRELERNIQAMPNDPRPLLALARLQRFDLRDYAAAALTLQRIVHLKNATPAIKQQAARELAELRSLITQSHNHPIA